MAAFVAYVKLIPSNICEDIKLIKEEKRFMLFTSTESVKTLTLYFFIIVNDTSILNDFRLLVFYDRNCSFSLEGRSEAFGKMARNLRVSTSHCHP